jgi:hypothetical protein
MAETKITLTIGELSQAFQELNLIGKMGLKINPMAGYWIAKLKSKLQKIHANMNVEITKVFTELAVINKDENGVEKKEKEIHPEHNQTEFIEYQKRVKAIKDIEDSVDFKMISYELLTKEAGTDSLPVSFWNNCGVHFVTEPPEK